VEEQFYLFWPPIVLLLRERKAALFAVTSAIVLFGYAQISHDIVPAISVYNYSGTLNRMGSLGLGALGAIWVSWKPLSSRVFRSLAVESMVLLLLAATLTFHFKYRYVLMGPCSLYLVLKAGNFNFRIKPIEWLVTNRKVVFVGMISYGIYLYHVPLTVLLNDHVFDLFWNAIPFDQFGPLAKMKWHSWIVKFPFYSFAAIGLATISFHGFESPILRLKDKWFPYRSVRQGSETEKAG
jgi:peptidoglycan/LPS O-acetylase OafA/YrhL